jgi:arylsulfatase A-like enzyme
MLAAFAAAGMGACARGGPERAPNVVLITLDTVRRDHLGCYGYARATSPALDAFAAVATRYNHAIATSSWTVPTHASLFTGLFAFEHGAHAFEVPAGTINNVNPLPAGAHTLAEALWGRGYTTGAVVANEAYLSPRWQLNQGFETYDARRAYAPGVNERVFRWLDAVHERPFFLFVNYIDAHRPYNTRPRPGVTPRPVTQDNGELLDSLVAAVMPGTGEVPAELAARVIDQYDTAVANLDDALGALIERLRRLGVYDNTVIVVTSDHGEYFGEHHLVEHSKDIYQEGLIVPLIVKAPGQTEGAVDERVTASTDVPRAILENFPEDWHDVLAQFPDAPGAGDVIAEIYYTRTKDLFDPRWGHRFQRIRTALYDGPYKLIASSDGGHELYRLDTDPREANNLFEAEPDAARRLMTRLQDVFAGRTASEERVDQAPLSDEELKRLRSLGYIGN